jgi:hypothetical protein
MRAIASALSFGQRIRNDEAADFANQLDKASAAGRIDMVGGVLNGLPIPAPRTTWTPPTPRVRCALGCR